MRVVDRALVRLLPAVPRAVVQRLSAPYIAGATLDDARRRVADLNAAGQLATVDVLGEEVRRAAEAEAIASTYHAALDAIAGDHLDANVSVKLTALGLEIDLDLCRSLLATVVADAAARGNFVRIDMEHSGVHGARRCASTASCETPAATTSGSCSSHAYDARSQTSTSSQTFVRACGSARGSTSSRPRSHTGGARDPRQLRPRHSTRSSSSVATSLSRPTTNGSSSGMLERVDGMESDAYELQMLLGVHEERAAARRGWAPTARVRAVRRPLVRVLAPSATGEPGARRDDREGDRAESCSGDASPDLSSSHRARLSGHVRGAAGSASGQVPPPPLSATRTGASRSRQMKDPG